MNPKQIQQMQRQVQQMQQQVEKIQAELGTTIVEGSAGGGAITVTMNGHREMQGIQISNEVVDPEDVEMLQDLILAAINDAAKKAQDLTEERMGPFTQMLPGMM